jgi:hypothetical protein
MTIAYEICRKKTGNATYSLVQKNGQEVVSKSIQVTYRVHVTDAADLNFGPADVDEDMVRNAPAPTVGATFNNTLPKAGDTVYETPAGDVYYWWRCTSVGVNRNTSNGLEFSVSCTFTDTTGKDAGETAVENPQLIAPIITYASEQHEVTAWTEDETYASPPEPCVLPTGSLYSNPPTKIVPQEVITFSQYEVGFTIDKYFERLYSLNDEIWNVYGPPVTGVRNSVPARNAMITDIAYEKTTVPIVNGTQTCYRVTYTIRVRRWELYELNDSGSIVQVSPKIGWDQPRVRADTRYRDYSPPYAAEGAVLPAANVGAWGHQQIYLKENGEAHAEDKQYGVPPYDILHLQPQIDFDTFLR